MLALMFLIAAPLDEPTLAVARTAYQKAHFEEVAQTLRDKDLSALDAPVRGEALFMLGVAELALRNDAPSQKALVRLFTEQPDFALPPYTAPKVVAACERAKKQVVVVLRPRIEQNKIIICGDGLPVRAGVRIIFNNGTSEQTVSATFAPPCFAAALAAGAKTYYVQASIDGEPRGEAGSRAHPLAVAPGKVAHTVEPLPVAPLPAPAKPLPAADKGPAKPLPVADKGPAKPLPVADKSPAKPLPVADKAPAKPLPTNDNAARPAESARPLAISPQPQPEQAQPSDAPLPPPTAETRFSRPWYETWWPWTIIGVLVVGGATAATLGVLLQHPTGTVRVTIQSP